MNSHRSQKIPEPIARLQQQLEQCRDAGFREHVSSRGHTTKCLV